MSNVFQNNNSYSIPADSATAERKLMRNVYGWMSLALAITGLTSYYVAGSQAILSVIFSNQFVFWGIAIAEFVLVMVLTAKINTLSFQTAGIMFAVYSILNGVLLSSIFVVYTMESIATTFFISAGMFAAMAVIGSTTKKDLSGIGRFALMAVIGLIIASLVNIFLKSTMLEFIVSIIGVIVFAALTAYDAQKIKAMLQEYGTDVNETSQKIALLGSLSLYLDFINMFLYLLRLFGRRN
ncbi:MAG: Bax inhibitor-1/YccA family protein [Paludibacteraceae bacterium]|nr:Bax inhibitor-1/YccA family protein [Paludibacteraceae bacterium]